VQRKARFIAQVMRERLDVGEIDDIGDAAVSYDEVKALATGDPRVLEKAQADADLTRLERLERAHYRGQETLARAAYAADANVASNTAESEAVAQAIRQRVDTRGEAFSMSVSGRSYTSRPDAGQALKSLLQPELDYLDATSRPRPHRVVGQLGGFDLTAHSFPAGDKVYLELTLDAVPRGSTSLTRDELRDANPTGLITRLENKLTGLERLGEQITADTERQLAEAQRARAQQSKPFPQADQLLQVRAHVEQLQRELQELADPAAQAAASAADSPGHPAARTSDQHSSDTASAGDSGRTATARLQGSTEADHAVRAAARAFRPDPAARSSANGDVRGPGAPNVVPTSPVAPARSDRGAEQQP